MVAQPGDGSVYWQYPDLRLQRYVTMAATVQGVAAELQTTQQRLVLSEQQNARLAESMDKMRNDMEAAMDQAQARIVELEQRMVGGKDRGMELVDIRTMDPGVFGGGPNESWEIWSKKVKAYCNARVQGFRAALDWSEAKLIPLTVVRWSL